MRQKSGSWDDYTRRNRNGPRTIGAGTISLSLWNEPPDSLNHEVKLFFFECANLMGDRSLVSRKQVGRPDVARFVQRTILDILYLQGKAVRVIHILSGDHAQQIILALLKGIPASPGGDYKSGPFLAAYGVREREPAYDDIPFHKSRQASSSSGEFHTLSKMLWLAATVA